MLIFSPEAAASVGAPDVTMVSENFVFLHLYVFVFRGMRRSAVPKMGNLLRQHFPPDSECLWPDRASDVTETNHLPGTNKALDINLH